ncbi:MAG: hypothetical protein ABJZ55_08055 [Fuerstiella sp.]
MREDYSADSIEHLEDLDAIRRRPAMYVGDLDAPESIDVLLQESLCVSLDLILADQAAELYIELNDDRSATVRDNGPGLPLEALHNGQTATEIIFGSMAPGCRHLKQDSQNSNLCGPGMACVTALSKWLMVNNSRDGAIWQTRFIRGVQVGPAERVSFTDSTGLEIAFRPDPDFFRTNRLDFDRFCDWFNNSSFELSMQSTVTVHCARTQKQATLHPAPAS